MAQDPSFFVQFVPPTADYQTYLARNPDNTTPGADYERQDAVRDARSLCDFGKSLLEIIERDYDKAVSEWKLACGTVLAALAEAIAAKNTVMAADKAEREADAARAELVFNLLTGISLRFVGAYLQYVTIPTVGTTELYNMGSGLLNFGLSEADFTKMVGSVFGGMGQELGRYAIARVHHVPKKSAHQVSEAARVELIRSEFEQYFADEVQVVKDQFTDVYSWLTQYEAFGVFWSDYSSNNLAVARMNIRKHLQTWRDTAMSRWEFFGSKPAVVNQGLLADQLQRGLWAAYIIDTVAAVEDQLREREIGGEGGGDGQYVTNEFDEDIFSEAVIDNLKVLNVVEARTVGGMMGQARRAVGGTAPLPNLLVADSGITAATDIRRLQKWAQDFVVSLPKGAAQYLPPAVKRSLPPLGTIVTSSEGN